VIKKEIVKKKKIKMSKRPDQEVWNEEEGRHDAAFRPYPTTVGSQPFAPLVINREGVHHANKHFSSRLEEIKQEWEKLREEFEITEAIYRAEYQFQPLTAETYHLYRREDQSTFLSLIPPQSWKQTYVCSVQLLTNGTWKKIATKQT
jgi:hypothetical protein